MSYQGIKYALGNPLIIVVALPIISTIYQFVRVFIFHLSGNLLIDFAFAIFYIVVTINVLQYQDRTIYALFFVYALSYLSLSIWTMYKYWQMMLFWVALNNAFFITEIVKEFLTTVFALLIMILSAKYFYDNYKKEQWVKNLTTPELITVYFNSTRLYWFYFKNVGWKNRIKQRTALSDLGWERHELKKRDPYIEDLALRATYPKSQEAKELAINEIIEKFGENTLKPLTKDWVVPMGDLPQLKFKTGSNRINVPPDPYLPWRF